MRAIFRLTATLLLLAACMVGTHLWIGCSNEQTTQVLDRMDRLTTPQRAEMKPRPPTYVSYEGIRVDGTDSQGREQWGYVDLWGVLHCCWSSQADAQAAADAANPAKVGGKDGIV